MSTKHTTPEAEKKTVSRWQFIGTGLSLGALLTQTTLAIVLATGAAADSMTPFAYAGGQGAQGGNSFGHDLLNQQKSAPPSQYDQNNGFNIRYEKTNPDGSKTVVDNEMGDSMIPNDGSKDDRQAIEGTTGNQGNSRAVMSSIGNRLSSENTAQGRAYQLFKDGAAKSSNGAVQNIRNSSMWDATHVAQRQGAGNILDSCSETTTKVDLSTTTHMPDEKQCTYAYDFSGECTVERTMSLGGTFTAPLFRAYGTTDHRLKITVDFKKAYGPATCQGSNPEITACAQKGGVIYIEEFEGGGSGYYGDQPQNVTFYDLPQTPDGFDGLVIEDAYLKEGPWPGCSTATGGSTSLSSAWLDFTCPAGGFQYFDHTVMGVFRIVKNEITESEPGCLIKATETDAFCAGDAIDKEIIWGADGTETVQISAHVKDIVYTVIGAGGGGAGMREASNCATTDTNGNCVYGSAVGGGGGGSGGISSGTATIPDEVRKHGYLTGVIGKGGSQGQKNSSGGTGGSSNLIRQDGVSISSAGGGGGGSPGSPQWTYTKCVDNEQDGQDCFPVSGGSGGSGGYGGQPGGGNGGSGSGSSGGAGGSTGSNFTYAPTGPTPGRVAASGAVGGGGAGAAAHPNYNIGGFGGNGFIKLNFTDYAAGNATCEEDLSFNVNGKPFTIEHAKMSGMKELYGTEYTTRTTFCKRAKIVENCQEHYGRGDLECYTDANGNQQCPKSDGSEDPNAQCEQLEADGCTLIEEVCDEGAESDNPNMKRCYSYTRTYDCGSDVTIPNSASQTTLSCGAVSCMGDECSDQINELNPDFGKALGALNSLEEMRNDIECSGNDPSTCRVFKGKFYNCKKAFSGIQDCCNKPANASLTDYLKLMYATRKLNDQMQIVHNVSSAIGADGALSSINGSWDAIQGSVSGTIESTLEPITRPIMSAVDSVQASLFGGGSTAASSTAAGTAQSAADGLSAFAKPSELLQTAQNSIADFTADVFGDAARDTLFSADAAGNYALGGAGTILGTIMTAYTVYMTAVLLIQIIFPCTDDEFELATKKELKSCHHVGGYCQRKVLGYCYDKRQGYCCYSSPLARIMQEQGKPQLGKAWGPANNPDCDGFTLAEMAQIDFNKVDLSEWIAMLTDAGIMPQDNDEFEERLQDGVIDRFDHENRRGSSAIERARGATGGTGNMYQRRDELRTVPKGTTIQ